MINFKSLWLLLTGLILSSTILTTGNAAYQKNITDAKNQTKQTTVLAQQDQNAKEKDSNTETKPENPSVTKKPITENSTTTDNKTVSSTNLSSNNNQQNKNETATSDNKTNSTSDQNNQTQGNSTNPTENQATTNQETTNSENPQKTPENQNSNPTQANPVPIEGNFTPPVLTQEEQKEYITINIENLGTYQVEINDGDTGWDAMFRAQNKYQFTMEYQQYDFGVYITQLGNIASEGTYYWALYYNNQPSMVGISDIIINPNDIISWKYESWM